MQPATHAVVIAALAVLAAYTVFGLVGFGAGIVAAPVMSLVLPLSLVIPSVLVLDPCFASMLGLRNRRQVVASELGRLLPGLAVGMALGLTLLTRGSEAALVALLGAFVVGHAAWGLAGRPGTRPVSPAWALPAGLAGGVFSALYGTGGPIYTTYLMRRIDDASRLRATMAIFIFALAWCRLAILLQAGLMRERALLTLVPILLPCAAVGFVAGSRLHARVAPARVRRLIWWLLLASGAALLAKGWALARA